MITENDIYWITRYDEIKGLLKSVVMLFTIVGSIGFISVVTFYFCAHGDNQPKLAATFKKGIYFFSGVLFIALVFGTTHAFVPTTKEKVAMVVIPKIANNENVQDIGQEFLDVAREWLQDLRPTRKKGLEKKGE